ncbi:Serine/threonine-protein kinase PknB [Gemmata sp. SH-PL17]|uniref:serine/threonine-protein kinase n=1 Tax=Gemmata sp. SH-PL17 TaxID=1630693 RepID=UPI00078BE870|nr:serine/threonine-protein kinase [Gemmata sp. SH-PL17]AMV29683.1 Serine/threonine-protein kinase PknB [Gemmata sp. SH-PL17]
MPNDPDVTRVPATDRLPADEPSPTVVRPADLPATDALLGNSTLRSGRPTASSLPTIPGYEVLREIARGGMGRVLAARDLTLGREVAIKVLLPGTAIHDTVSRFVTESKITARLPHPNVPPVYALGTLTDGSPFLAMKLIAGTTFTNALRSRTAPTDDLPRFVQTFEQVCLAVGFAHSQGVIHRDLKPSNIMVGAFGEVQVMDWGLAKSVAATDEREPDAPAPEIGDETQAGQVMGTPAYMAPEQARGELVDSRADVFALGAILSEILTGARLFVGKTSAEVVACTAANDIGDVLDRLNACGADTELVALAKHCLSLNAADRPADGKAVADAVAAYRAGVEERLRTSERQRAADAAKAIELRKRRRVQVALAGALVLLLFSAAAFTVWEMQQAAERRLEASRLAAEHKADIERAEREKQEAALRQQAKDNEAAAENRQALTELVKRCEEALVASDELAAGAALADIDRRANAPGAEDFRARIDRCRKDRAMLVTLNRIDDQRWTPTRGSLPPPSAAVPHWGRAFNDYGIIPGTTAPADVVRLLEGSPIRERVLASLELWHLFGTPPGLSETLHAIDPDPTRDAIRNESRQKAWARVSQKVKELVGGTGTPEQPTRFVAAVGIVPEIAWDQRRALLEQAAARTPNDFAVLMGLGGTRPNPSPAAIGERVRWCQAAVSVRPQSFVPRMSLGIALWEQGKQSDSIRCFRDAVRLGPENAWCHYNLAKALRDSGDVRGAIAELREAVRLAPREALIRELLGTSLGMDRDLPGAIAELREAVRLAPEHAGAHHNLGTALLLSRDLDGAIAEFREAVRLQPDEPNFLYTLANALWDKRDLDGAEEYLRKAIASDKNFTSAHYSLGLLLKEKGDAPGAIAEYREAIRLDPKHARAYYGLGIVLRASGDVPGAIAAYRKLLELNPNHSAGHNGLGNALADTGDLDGAIAEFREALRLNPNNGPAKANLADRLKEKAEHVAPPPRETKKR